MIRNMDRFAQGAAKRLATGQRVRMPLRLGDKDLYRHSFEVIAFGAGQSSFGSPGMAHTVFLRRLADGLILQVSQHWVTRYNGELHT